MDYIEATNELRRIIGDVNEELTFCFDYPEDIPFQKDRKLWVEQTSRVLHHLIDSILGDHCRGEASDWLHRIQEADKNDMQYDEFMKLTDKCADFINFEYRAFKEASKRIQEYNMVSA